MPTLTALDLSLSATGLFHGDPENPQGRSVLAEIATPDRRIDEDDVAWNARRFDLFSKHLLAHLRAHRPELVVIEVTGHAHQWVTRRRGGQDTTAQTSRGQEFRAGLGLGRALGWIDGLLVLASAYGSAPARVETIEARIIKLRIAGAQTASKAAVRAHLKELFGWDTAGWRESQVDALAAGLAYVRTQERMRVTEHLEAVAARPRRARRGRAAR